MAVTKNISLDYQDVIVIGRRGENEAVDIVWDISPLVAEFGGGTALVLAKRATDESAYPVTLTEQTDTTLTWTVSSVDSCVIGVGKVQLFWYVGNVLAKSFMWRTFTGDDITGMVGDPPEAYESWIEHLAEMGADILNDAKDEVKNAEAWAVGERGGEPVVDGDETYHNNSKYWSGVSSDYAGNAESSADAAEQSAGDAAHQVELAEAQVALAEQKVQDAAAQVALAEEQANAAAGSASDASGYALAASGYASDANTFSGQAYTSAQNAEQSASDAAGYALAASGSATDANTYKGQAQGFANAASGYADNASTYADNASGYADAASDSADAAAASATEAAGYVASLVNGKAGVLEDSASGDVVSIVPDKSVGKLYKAEVSLSPIQSGSGDPSPTNVRPISGHTGATLNVTGKNLYPVKIGADEFSNNVGATHSNDNGTLVINTSTGNSSGVYSRGISTIQDVQRGACAGQTITYSYDVKCSANVNLNLGLQAYGYKTVACTTEWQRVTHTATITGAESSFIAYSNGTAVTIYIKDFQIELGSSASAYEPYVGSQHTSSFGQTVYGGTFDFVSGKLVIDHALHTDRGSAGWNRNADGSFFIWQSWASSAEQTADGCYCNYAPYAVSFDGMSVFVRSTNSTISLGRGWGEIYATADELKAAFAQNPLQIVYKLATPIEIDLDPTEVQTLLGLNNVWSDGEMSVDYAADLKTYIDNKIAAAVAALS